MSGEELVFQPMDLRSKSELDVAIDEGLMGEVSHSFDESRSLPLILVRAVGGVGVGVLMLFRRCVVESLHVDRVYYSRFPASVWPGAVHGTDRPCSPRG